MPLMDEFKEEREAMKHGTPKQKFDYFMDYYKWHVIIGVGILFMVISLVSQMLSNKKPVFYAAMINGMEQESAEEYKQKFAEYAGLNLEKNSIVFDTSIHVGTADSSYYNPDALASSEKLMVYIASGEIDVFVTAEDTFLQYAYNDFFLDLRTLLTQEQIAEYEPYFYYLDQTVLDEKKAAEDALNYDHVPVYPVSDDPGAMSNPVPVGIYIPEANALRENYLYAGDEIVIGVVANTKRPETVSDFLDFLLQ